MFCPNCRSEYQKGITRCSDCDVDLVDELPKIESPEFDAVLSTYNPADVALIKSILEGEPIEYYFQGENSSSILQTMGIPAILMVRKEQVEEVKDLLKDLSLTYSIHFRESGQG